MSMKVGKHTSTKTESYDCEYCPILEHRGVRIFVRRILSALDNCAPGEERAAAVAVCKRVLEDGATEILSTPSRSVRDRDEGGE